MSRYDPCATGVGATPAAFEDTDRALVELRDLLAECYAVAGEPPDWSFALLEHWYYSHRASRLRSDPAFWRENARLWRDESGKLVGFVAADSGGDPVYVAVHPSYRWVEEPMLRWLSEDRVAATGKVTIAVRTDDRPRQEALARLGFAERGEASRRYRYDLAAMSLDYSLPAGFVVRGMGETGDDEDFTRQAALTRAVFPGSEYDREAHDCLRRAPDYSPSLDLAVVAPSGEHVAIACAMLDARNRIGDFEPVGTHPAYRRRGLARAVVFEAFRRLRERGARYAFICTGGEPYHANRFYTALGPVGVEVCHEWVKEQSARPPIPE